MLVVLINVWCSTRVSNELGGGNAEGARHATRVALKLTAILAVSVVCGVWLGHNIWAASFTDSPLVVHAFASMIPFLVASLLCDFLQGILSGVARGCGWQQQVVYINIGSFYFIGMPLATLLAFHFLLHAKVLLLYITNTLLPTVDISIVLICQCHVLHNFFYSKFLSFSFF